MQWLQRSVGLAIIGTATLGRRRPVGSPSRPATPSRGSRRPRACCSASGRSSTTPRCPRRGCCWPRSAWRCCWPPVWPRLERRLVTRARRSEDPDRMPLAPKLVMAETRGVYAGPVTITVLIPAHNEESVHLRDPRLAAVAVAPPGARGGGGRQLHRRDRAAGPRGRRRRARDGRQHPQEGRRPQPGPARGPARPRRQRLRDGDGRRHDPRPGLPRGRRRAGSPTTGR